LFNNLMAPDRRHEEPVSLASDEEFEEFVTASLPRLLRFAHMLTGNSAAAEDLVQTALGRSWRAWQLGGIDDPLAFVRKVMVNSHSSWYRRYGGRETAVANPPEKVTHDEAGRIDDRDAVCRALLTLPPRQRAVIVLRYYEELTEQEIAAVMAISPGTVKSQAARALKHLAAILSASDQAIHVTHGAADD